MKRTLKILCMLTLLPFAACEKNNKEPEHQHEHVHEQPSGNGSVRINFENKVDAATLVFGDKYLNPKLDTFKVNMLKYYISNVVLVKEDNSTFTEPDSYHLVDHAIGDSKSFVINNVPAGHYTSIRFMLGVDSARNNSGSQTGALDPAKGMFWTWNSGYIMFKLEGTAPKSGDANKNIIFHVGGFGGVNKAQRNFNLSFNSNHAEVSSAATSQVYLTTNINELFKSPTLIDFTTQYYQMMAGANAKMYADNYADMITFDHVSN